MFLSVVQMDIERQCRTLPAWTLSDNAGHSDRNAPTMPIQRLFHDLPSPPKTGERERE